MVLSFSVLTAFEVVWFESKGIKIFARLRADWESGKRTKFFFEATGLIAFVLIQPIVLTSTVVWAFGELAPVMENATMLLQSINQSFRG
tara:strand:+ start:1722 stop:1988 length:267 start_codon:yes stop_codon:yes gene_type:complete